MSDSTLRWSTRIAFAQQRGSFNDDERRDARNWLKCAVAEHAPDCRRDEYDRPFEPDLFYYGTEFSMHVKDNNFSAARAALHHVERVARQLKQHNEGERQ